ncbi:MAG: pyruvate:ferredoxin (flavodoxin) oxidoreductase [Spirochaetes bacterium]|nr:pyruvate:ferredoxin (flavodoxin) oxidoreductase [Spirochaetota bacterium]
MANTKKATVDGNTAAAHAAYAFSEVAAIYPITPSSNMAEYADEWAAQGRKNMFGEVLDIVELQSEGGAAGAVHGILSGGSLATTFTASQGLLLMIPNMHKIAGEMLPTVFYVSARSLACQSLSIYGDHSDVMGVRNTGFALVAANNIQEVQDLGIISQLATLEGKVPFLAFFDGFRTSHEVQKVELAEYDTIKEMLDMKYVEEFRKRALTPDKPFSKVGAQNPDVYFQGRETVNKYYTALPSVIKKYMKAFGAKFGRNYNLFDYVGDPNAERVIIAMGSGCETIEETVNALRKNGEKIGLLKVRVYRPFDQEAFIAALPKSATKIAVLDRTKEPGALGEPLYLDVVTALKDVSGKKIIGGRYGLSSKEFTPPMVKAVYDHLAGKCTHNFTVGINDDVTNLSLPVGGELVTEDSGVIRCKFWGYGSDGTVSANKNSIKIIGDHTDYNVQAYFVYDSKKSGGITISHLRFGKAPIQSQYLLTTSDFVALHNQSYIGRYDILEGIKDGGTFLINCEWPADKVFENLTKDMQETIIKKKVKVYTIDATHIAREVGLGNRISSVMQTAFFAKANILPQEEAIGLVKKEIEKTFKKKGKEIIEMNWNAVDKTVAAIAEVKVPSSVGAAAPAIKLVPDNADAFVKGIIEPVMRLKGDDIPVSRMSFDGTVPTGTTALEKRGIAIDVPCWMSENCSQCNQCSFVCPHATIRPKLVSPADVARAPKTFTTVDAIPKNEKGNKFRVQVYTEDCVGCGVCVDICPGMKGKKALKMVPIAESRKAGENENLAFFESLPEILDGVKLDTLKGSQFKKPLFEFSGACAGCGETAYIKLATQLFGDRMIISNATGCSSIYGGTFPTIPYTKNAEGKGPAWGNSLFEDNAEYGFGMRLALNANRKQLLTNVKTLLSKGTTPELTAALTKAVELFNKTDNDAKANAKAVADLLPAAFSKAAADVKPVVAKIIELKDYFVDKSVWIIGGDGWAYDIGYGGLDHVLASGQNVNVLVVDTEVYSNTGGQASKSTPRGAIAKFAATGKKMGKKNLGLMMMSYGNVYVASVNMGASRPQVLKAMLEAEAYNGPSIIIAYAACIAHGMRDMGKSVTEEKLASDAGHWPVYRFNPMVPEGTNPLTWESKEVTADFMAYIKGETRYRALESLFPSEAEKLFPMAKKDADNRFATIKKML